MVLPFLAEEKVAGVIVPSRDSEHGGGTGIIFDDNSAALGARLRERLVAGLESRQPAQAVDPLVDVLAAEILLGEDES